MDPTVYCSNCDCSYSILLVTVSSQGFIMSYVLWCVPPSGQDSPLTSPIRWHPCLLIQDSPFSSPLSICPGRSPQCLLLLVDIYVPPFRWDTLFSSPISWHICHSVQKGLPILFSYWLTPLSLRPGGTPSLFSYWLKLRSRWDSPSSTTINLHPCSTVQAGIPIVSSCWLKHLSPVQAGLPLPSPIGWHPCLSVYARLLILFSIWLKLLSLSPDRTSHSVLLSDWLTTLSLRPDRALHCFLLSIHTFVPTSRRDS